MFSEGDVLDSRYRLLRALGQGGMGTVFDAEDQQLGRRVAIKLLSPQVAALPDIPRRFQAEARAASLIDHPGIVTVHDIRTLPDGQLYIVMEKVDGTTLDLCIQERRLSDTDALRVLRETALAIEAAHAAGIVHRDLKPSNIFVVREPRGSIVKVVDFGIAKLESKDPATLTGTGELLGSPAYMSPEQMSDVRETGPWTDIYALGLIAFELFAGRRPFDTGNPFQLLRVRMEQPAPRLSKVRPDLPPELSSLVARMLDRDRLKRPASMAEVANELDALLPEGPRMSSPEVRESSSPAEDRPAMQPSPPPAVDAAGAGPPDQARTLVRKGTEAAAPGLDRKPRFVKVSPTNTLNMHAPVGLLSKKQVQPPDAQNVSGPAGTLVFKPSTGGSAASMAQPPEPFEALDRVLPASMTEASSDLRSFLAAIAADCTRVADRAVELLDVKVAGAAHHSFFAVFVEPRETSRRSQELGHRTFVGNTGPLELHLAALGPGVEKVVLAIVDAAQIGRGVRKHIAQFRQNSAVVVPLLVAEVRNAVRRGRARRVFEERLAEFHARSNPFLSNAPTRDPTRFYGLKSELNALTRALAGEPTIVTVFGPPGSGKTSLVLRAEHDLGDMRAITVPCRELLQRTPAALADEIERALRAGPARGSEPPTPVPAPIEPAGERTILERIESAGRAAAGAAADGSHDRILLVIDDADDLVDALCHAGDEEQRKKALELWGTLAQAVRKGLLSAIVTGFRAGLLADRHLGSLPNPAFGVVLGLPLSPLSSVETQLLVEEIGFEEDVSFELTTVHRIHEVTGGNVDFIRRVCSAALDLDKGQRRPLERVTITAEHIDLAVAELASRPDTMSAFSPWLRRADERVLRAILDGKPRSAREVESALGDAAAPGSGGSALSRLESMGLITPRGGRYEIRIPLVSDWVGRNIPPPPAREAALRHRRTLILGAGVALTALLFGAYVTWFQAKSVRTEIASFDDCRYMVEHPERGTAEDHVLVTLWRECEPLAAPDPLALVPAMGTAAKVEETLSGKEDVIPCPPSNSCRTVHVRVTLLSANEGRYEFELRRDTEARLRFSVLDDPFASFKRTFDGAVGIARWVPIALSMFLAFFGDLLALLRRAAQMVRGDPAALAAKGSPPADAKSPGETGG